MGLLCVEEDEQSGCSKSLMVAQSNKKRAQPGRTLSGARIAWNGISALIQLSES
jgi:hypothetical protein